MLSLSIGFAGNSDAVVLSRLEHVPPELRAALAETMERVVRRLHDYVLTRKLVGAPGTIHAARGPLHRAIEHGVSIEPNGVRGWVGIREGSPVLRYARVHEFGGTIHVPAHPRRGGVVRAFTYEARRRSFLASAGRELTPEISETVRRVVARSGGG